MMIWKGIRWCYLRSKGKEDVHTVDLVSRKERQVHMAQFGGVWFGDPQRTLKSVAEIWQLAVENRTEELKTVNSNVQTGTVMVQLGPISQIVSPPLEISGCFSGSAVAEPSLKALFQFTCWFVSNLAKQIKIFRCGAVVVVSFVFSWPMTCDMTWGPISSLTDI